MSITITLTADEADALYDVLNHTSNDIGERLPDSLKPRQQSRSSKEVRHASPRSL